MIRHTLIVLCLTWTALGCQGAGPINPDGSLPAEDSAEPEPTPPNGGPA